MSPDQLQSLVNFVEEKLQSDLILSSNNGQYPSSNRTEPKKICKYLGIRLLHLFGWCHQVLVCYSYVSDSSVWSLWFIDMLHGLGSCGCLLSACYMCGYTLLLLHLKVVGRHERKHQLHLLRHMKTAHKLDFTPEERKEYSRNLHWIILKNKVVFAISGMPMTLFYLLGAIVTGIGMKSWYFWIGSIFMLVMYGITSHHCIIIFADVHLMIAHSTNYFRIRIRKLRIMIQEWNNQATGVSKRKTKQLIHSMSALTSQLESLLVEIQEHNKTVKYFLRDIETVLGPMMGLLIVFFASDSPWYLRTFAAGGSVVIFVAAISSLYNASGLHITLLKLSNDLHSCQVNLRLKRHMDAKLKYHVLRLVHRTSSPNLPVGFTAGETGSFTPGSAGSFISQVISVTLVFLNSNLIQSL